MLEGLVPGVTRDDGWTVPEVVAHIAAWHRVSAGRLERLAAGELMEPPDADPFNAVAQARAAEGSREDLRGEAEAARRAVLAAVGRLSDETANAHDALGAFIVGANGAHHYAEHLADFAAPD